MDSFAHPGQNFAGAEFEEAFDALGDEAFDAIFPAHAARDLSQESVADGVFAHCGLAGDVAEGGDAVGRDGGGLEDGGEAVLGGLHEFRVVGAGHIEGEDAFEAERLALFDGVWDEGFGARKNDLAGAVIIGDLESAGSGEGLGLGGGGSDEGEHAALGGQAGFLHEAAAAGDEFEAVGEREVAGGGVGGEFAEGEACGGGEGEVRAFLFQEGEEGEAMDEEGGLTVAGVGEALFGAFEANGGESVVEDCISLLVEGGCFRGDGDQVTTHADVLGTLAGKE